MARALTWSHLRGMWYWGVAVIVLGSTFRGLLTPGFTVLLLTGSCAREVCGVKATRKRKK